MKRHVLRHAGWALLLILIIPALAQGGTCPALVEEALSAIGDRCEGLERNAACYGYDRVDSIFATPQPAGFFSQPADRAGLLELTTVQTAPLDTAAGTFGVAVLNAQANVPGSLPGQGVIFLVMGDATLTNEVAPENAFQPAAAVAVTTAAATTLYSLPSAAASVRTSVPAATTLDTDGVDVTGAWLRVLYEGGIAWAARTAFATVPDGLPVLSAAARTPMQAFYFNTGIGAPACNEADAAIAIQSPEGITVDLTVNGMDIQVGSLVTLTRNTLTVHRGQVVTSFGQTVAANQTLVLPLDEAGNFAGSGDLRDITEDEFERGEQVQDGLNNVADSNNWPERTVTPREEDPEPATGDITYIVQPGDTLFSIGRRFAASLPEIVRVNGLVEPFILRVGQTLIIPGAGSGFVGLPERPGPNPARPTPTPTPGPQSGPTTLDCTGFQRLGGGDTPISTFRWTLVAGADQYKLNFYGVQGNFVTSLLYASGVSSADVNMGDIGTGGAFQWEVEALLRGQSGCNTGRSDLIRKPEATALPPQPTPEGTQQVNNFSASSFCVTAGVASVSWNNLPAGETVFIFGDAPGLFPDYNGSFTTATGTQIVNPGSGLVGVNVTTTLGDNLSFPGC
ncbi:MAG: LysM peptidoglycan-binding domain-containing protein [Anaerolineae bacterium]|nr:LysM peptidoglycan-binding domain-containing protein [Anaerolineae bacterium]